MGTLKILRIALQVIFSLAMVYLALFMEVRILICSASLPGGILLLISSLLECKECYDWDRVFGGLGCLLCSFWIFSLSLGTICLKRHEDGKRVSVVQAFYPWVGQKLAEGNRLDTLRLASCYSTCYSRYDINYNSYYLLSQEDDAFVLFSSYGKVLEGKSVKFDQREFDHGKIDVCTFVSLEGKHVTLDLYGNNVDSVGYYPLVIDSTPNYNSNI